MCVLQISVRMSCRYICDMLKNRYFTLYYGTVLLVPILSVIFWYITDNMDWLIALAAGPFVHVILSSLREKANKLEKFTGGIKYNLDDSKRVTSVRIEMLNTGSMPFSFTRPKLMSSDRIDVPLRSSNNEKSYFIQPHQMIILSGSYDEPYPTIDQILNPEFWIEVNFKPKKAELLEVLNNR